MSEDLIHQPVAQFWYARPVFFVKDLDRALLFYLNLLGFTKKWHVNDVCQVDRGGCEIILCQDGSRQDKGRLFIELNRDGMDELNREISQRSIPTERTWWGYDSIRVLDPDGNEILFPLDQTNDREHASKTETQSKTGADNSHNAGLSL